MKVQVERYIEQVCDGSYYKGYLKIANTTFDYELKFTVPIGQPIPQLDDMEPVKRLEEIRRLFQLTVKKNGVNIELTDEEYGFFFRMLVEFAVTFYNNPQTRECNEGFLKMALRSEGPMADFGASASIGITSSGSCNFPLELCEMLRAPKFGCPLVV